MPLFVQSQLTIPYFLQDGMVLQRETTLDLNGKANPFSNVEVKTTWLKEAITVKADSLGLWNMKLSTGKAGGPYKITFFNEKKEITIQDILLGDVWICSGQSNMEWRPEQGLSSGMEVVKSYASDQLRFFTIPRNACSEVQKSVPSTWQKSNPTTNFTFSAAGFFFGKMLQDSLKVPVGIINSTWGGTRAEQWMPEQVLEGDSLFSPLLSDFRLGVKGEQLNPFSSALWNGMIAPLTGFPISGVCWYQGESNAGNPILYQKLLPALIKSWRDAWKIEFPFYIVQLAPYNYDIAIYASMTREAQRITAHNDSLSGLVVTMDIGDLNDIHPRNKKDVGFRLARIALAKHYGKSTAYSGPVLSELIEEGDRLILKFEHLNFPKEYFLPLNCFRISDDGLQFIEANAYLENNVVTLSHPSLRNPKYVRFAFEKGDLPNFKNEYGLPASPFRTDTLEMNLPPK